ncbi:MAG: hypothetical protein Q7K26_01815 [bacterium]|nr:hypothetical protein [bacterium]
MREDSTNKFSILNPVVGLPDPIEGLKGSDWFDQYLENSDLYLSRKEVIEQAFHEAPNEAARGYIYGICEFRHRLALLTGIPFK